VLSNFLHSENPFGLAPPPAWWLQTLFDYDSQLVVFPSRHRMAYILARRRRFSNAMQELNTLDKNLLKTSAGLDGDIMATNNLIYVRHLIGDTVRRPAIFQWLRDNDITANGGGEAVATKIETIEETQARMTREKMQQDIDFRARDAWRSYQARTGQRTKAGGQFRPSAIQMPTGSFTPAEPSVAMFARD
jgi:hypothetical protein